jgi:uncharacterized protein YegL
MQRRTPEQESGSTKMSDWFDEIEEEVAGDGVRGISTEEGYPILPICVTIDVSGSMMESGAIRAVNDCLPDLKRMVEEDPMVGEMARLGVVTFENTAKTVLPIADISMCQMPHLSAGGGTSYTAGLRETKSFFEYAIPTFGKGVRFYKPVVFFISDGLPLDGEASWMAAARDLASSKYAPHIVCFGMADADMSTLSKIANTFAFKAKDGDPIAATREVFRQVIGSIKVTSASAGQAAASGGEAVFGMDPSVAQAFDFAVATSTSTI